MQNFFHPFLYTISIYNVYINLYFTILDNLFVKRGIYKFWIYNDWGGKYLMIVMQFLIHQVISTSLILNYNTTTTYYLQNRFLFYILNY